MMTNLPWSVFPSLLAMTDLVFSFKTGLMSKRSVLWMVPYVDCQVCCGLFVLCFLMLISISFWIGKLCALWSAVAFVMLLSF